MVRSVSLAFPPSSAARSCSHAVRVVVVVLLVVEVLMVVGQIGHSSVVVEGQPCVGVGVGHTGHSAAADVVVEEA